MRTSDYHFELILQPQPDQPEVVVAYVRRTDDVGRGFEDVLDSHGHVQQSSWNARGGNKCLTSGGGLFSFDDSPDHAFTYGLAGRSVRRVVITMADGTTVRARTTPDKTGEFRGWMTERPLGDVERIDGYNRRGRHIATVTLSPFFRDFRFGQADTCTPFPFP